ncbi:conserved hypothetical protein [Neospora caninum Liverpool]|uniref:Uncharacterized protein n=1 Tax=Neospora caninum (strain Liverpool) TaxID=572307 RepID=F0VFL8_NEOCL|nr:conserved hypothetical protein [Neospora caninum Liverpool]CBZ52512.1 conserved hypothetical protein [Neospora caninum Liverpool]CEL66489.1 TPA: hypothetical protein BN1204_023010 [Neospora caninum Liverpool]|eukprot:XP_003882544.1 conserved hypothetical protein [Neospora caninum Liverpool]
MDEPSGCVSLPPRPSPSSSPGSASESAGSLPQPSSPVSPVPSAVSSSSVSSSGVDSDCCVDDSLYSVDVKAMRYLSLSAFLKAGLHQVVSAFSASDAPSVSSGMPLPPFRSYAALNAAFHGAAEREEIRREEEVREADQPWSADGGTEEEGNTPTETAANLLKGSERGDSATPLFSVPFLDVVRSLWPYGAEAAEGAAGNAENNAADGDLAEILSMKQLALVDAGVYVRPNLSEMLAGLEDENQMRNLVNRCRAIDEELARLFERKKCEKDEAQLQCASSSASLSAVSEASCPRQTRAESPSSLPSSMPASMPLPAEQASLLRLAAVSAEATRLQEEKRRLQRRMEHLRALSRDLWSLFGLDTQRDRVSLALFQALFCSNPRCPVQAREAETLFQLCQGDGEKGELAFEDMLLGLPTGAYEVMFVVREMKRKTRQTYRYFWI